MKNHYYNPGKFLRALLPEQTVTQGAILLWTAVYFLNLAAVLLVQHQFVYNVLPPENPFDPAPFFQVLEEKPRFDGYTFLDMDRGTDDMLILCSNEAGEKVILRLKKHSYFHRYRLTTGETPVTDGAEIDLDGPLGTRYLVVQGSEIVELEGYSLRFSNATNIFPPLLLSLIPFLLEILIFNRIRALFR